MNFEIREQDSIGKLLGVIEAPIFFEAARLAAARFFKKPMATRETGWQGAAGVWAARGSVDDPPTSERRFWVGVAP
jgi:hypothetical protein